SGAMSSKLHLRSVAEEQVTAQPLASRKLSATIINKTQSPLSWKNNLLTITETGALAKRSKLASQQRLLTVRSVNAPKSNPIDIEASVGITLKGEFLFEPQLTSDIEWDYFSIERYETTVTGHFSFDGSVEFDFAGSATIDDPMKKVFTRTFTSKYVIGGVPVYQETTLTLNVKFTAKAETAIKATVNNHLSAQISINTLYENGQWQETSSRNFDKSLTVTAQVQGSVSAEIRLIPEVKVRFYKVASLAVRVEPFLNGEIAAEAVTQVNLIDEGFLSEYSFTKFDSFVGVDVNFYTDLKIFSKEIARYPKTGLKKLYEKKWQLFGLPKLEVSLQGAPNIHGPMTMTGKTTPFKNAFGYENTIDSSSLRWSGFPANTSGTGLTFNWQPDSHGEIYSIYFIGNSIALGDFGQQYQIQEIDMRDSDGDGMPNAWEAYYDFDMNNSNDAAEDADQDEITNLDEYLAYTDPRGLSCTNYQTDHNYSAPPEGGTVEYTTESTLDFSKNVFTWLPRQDSSGTWKSYLNRRDEYYIDDPTNIEFVYDYLTFKEDMDTGFCWVTNVEKLTRYDVSGDLNQEFSYIAKQNADGSWWSIQAGTAFDYFPWGAVQRSYPYIAKQNDNGYWVSVQEGTQIAYSRYYDGLKESETPYIAKQSDNGNWVGVIAGTQVRYSVKIDNGTSENYIAQKAPYIAIKNSDGRWVSTVEGTVTDYYSDASKSYEINYIAKMNENGTWLGVREGTGTSYYENGAKWGETPYLAKQNDNGNWTSVIEGTATDYYQSGAISRLSIYINDVRISYCSFDDDGTPTGCITL
ncbi:MAG: hypothetical protein MJK12_19165, partial [Colwellia sp.]|nr:hypothetical protein [Colwellia sp.]